MTDSFFSFKQTNETCVINNGTYMYVAECHFTKNGVKQIWRYESSCNLKERNQVSSYKRII